MTESPSPSADLDLRLVRCFTVLAEHQHFGRAANALHLTQSSLSRQIDRLEQQVGARLLDRTPRGSQLTEAGEVFLPLALEILGSASQASARARAAARPSQPRSATVARDPGSTTRSASARSAGVTANRTETPGSAASASTSVKLLIRGNFTTATRRNSLGPNEPGCVP